MEAIELALDLIQEYPQFSIIKSRSGDFEISCSHSKYIATRLTAEMLYRATVHFEAERLKEESS